MNFRAAHKNFVGAKAVFVGNGWTTCDTVAEVHMRSAHAACVFDFAKNAEGAGGEVVDLGCVVEIGGAERGGSEIDKTDSHQFAVDPVTHFACAGMRLHKGPAIAFLGGIGHWPTAAFRVHHVPPVKQCEAFIVHLRCTDGDFKSRALAPYTALRFAWRKIGDRDAKGNAFRAGLAHGAKIEQAESAPTADEQGFGFLGRHPAEITMLHASRPVVEVGTRVLHHEGAVEQLGHVISYAGTCGMRTKIYVRDKPEAGIFLNRITPWVRCHTNVTCGVKKTCARGW